MDTKTKSEIANVAILGRMAPSDFSLEAVTGESAAPVKSLEFSWLRDFGGQTSRISMGWYWNITGIFIFVFGINGRPDFWGPMGYIIILLQSHDGVTICFRESSPGPINGVYSIRYSLIWVAYI